MRKKVLAMVMAFIMVMGMALSYGGSVEAAQSSADILKAKPWLENDFRELLPYEDLIGAKLNSLKNAVNNSETYVEEDTSLTYDVVTGEEAPVEIAYAFSDRKYALSQYGYSKESVADKAADGAIAGAGKGAREAYEKAQNSGKGGIWSWLSGAKGALAGAFKGGIGSAAKAIGKNMAVEAGDAFVSGMEASYRDVTYYYVATDGSKDEIIIDVFIVSSKVSFKDKQEELFKKYPNKFYEKENEEYWWMGLVSGSKDYAKAIDYYKNKKYKEAGIVYLFCYESDNGRTVVWIGLSQG